MRHPRVTAVVIILTSMVVVGCGSTATRHTVNKPPSDSAVEPPQAAQLPEKSNDKAEAAERKNFRDAMAMRLQKIEQEIMELRMKAAKLPGKAKSEWDEGIARLEARVAEAQARLKEMEASATDMWAKLRDEASHTWEELEAAVKKAFVESEDATPAPEPAAKRSGESD